MAAPQAGQFSIGAEALRWWMKDSPVPFPIITDGVMGESDTQVLLGDEDLSTGTHPGVRISAAYALSEQFGLEGSLFHFASRSTSDGVESSGELGSTDLFLPYIDASTGQESATEFSLAPIYRGSAREELSNQLQGAELNATWALAPHGSLRMDLLGGIRYLRLREVYTLSTQSPYTPAFGPDIWDTSDRFDTRNNFYGVQLGLRGRIDKQRFFADGSVKLGLGAMQQSTDVDGSLVTNDFTEFGPTQTYIGGYFALPSNIGRHSRTELAIVPEAALNVGYRVTDAATINLGYSFLYVDNVLRPGNQVNRTIDTTQSTSWTEDPEATFHGTDPAFRFNRSSFWAQGINLGLTVRF